MNTVFLIFATHAEIKKSDSIHLINNVSRCLLTLIIKVSSLVAFILIIIFYC